VIGPKILVILEPEKDKAKSSGIQESVDDD